MEFSPENLIDIRRLAEAQILMLSLVLPFPDRERESERQRQIAAATGIRDKINDHLKDVVFEEEQKYAE